MNRRIFLSFLTVAGILTRGKVQNVIVIHYWKDFVEINEPIVIGWMYSQLPSVLNRPIDAFRAPEF